MNFDKKSNKNPKNTIKNNQDNFMYRIEGSKEQIELISHACEVLARIRRGQINMVVDELPLKETVDRNQLAMSMEDDLDAKIKSVNSIDDAFTIYQVVRHRLSWDEKPEGGTTVSFNEPLNFEDKPMVRVERVEKKVISQEIFNNQPRNIISAHIDKNGWLFINECSADQLMVFDGQHLCQIEGKWSYPITSGYNSDNWEYSAIDRIN